MHSPLTDIVASGMSTMRDGDIFRWNYKDDFKHVWARSCKAYIAVCHGGELFDTYWSDRSSDRSSDSRLDLSLVTLTLLGNANDCTAIRSYDVDYYDRADIIDMRHANSSNAPIYLKKGAQRSKAAMLEFAQRKSREAQYALQGAMRDIDRWEIAISAIEAGKLDEVWL